MHAFGELDVGKCTYTSSGNLADNGIKYVIHTVGPRFSEQESLMLLQQQLYDSVMNALVMANKLKCKSIALPAISSGIFGFPLPRVAQVIFSAINDFICEQIKNMMAQTSIRRIRVVNWDQPTTDYMQAEFDFISETSTPSIEADLCQ